MQSLPGKLSIWNEEISAPYRGRLQAEILNQLHPAQVLEAAKIIADAFAAKEPMCRHLALPISPPDSLFHAIHSDAFGAEVFGSWNTANILRWFVRCFVLTDATSDQVPIPLNQDVMQFSLAITDSQGHILGAAMNETMPPIGITPAFRVNDPYLDAIGSFMTPILDLLGSQDAAAITALSEKYPDFRDAHANGKVGHHFMIAKSDMLPSADTFELCAASAGRFREQGYKYLVVEATNQWTGAACEALGATAVHFSPYRVNKVVAVSSAPISDTVSSADGFISGKDSGSMFYALRLR